MKPQPPLCDGCAHELADHDALGACKICLARDPRATPHPYLVRAPQPVAIDPGPCSLCGAPALARVNAPVLGGSIRICATGPHQEVTRVLLMPAIRAREAQRSALSRACITPIGCTLALVLVLGAFAAWLAR
jgi:hypothetical protein